jgi:glycosyltransferase involved in cell wall biosynthesis
MISVILPAYNEGTKIGDVIEETVKALDNTASDWEIVVVDDGSEDSTPTIVKEFAENDGRIKVFSYEKNKGKGFALKYGFEHSRGDIVVFMDADLDLHPRQIKKFIEIMNKEGADIVIGSKRHPESTVSYPIKRRVLSDIYFLMVKILFNLNVKDTQVGLKLFRRKVLRDVMPRILVKRYAFDVEVLANAVKRGYKIVEAPVEITFNYDSRINWKAIWNMFVDTLAVAYKMYIKKYYDRV